jgi:putative Holliday junction resolvase
VRERLKQEEAVGVVVGLPLLPSGDRGEQAIKVEAFLQALRAALTIPVDLWDESFTTLEAERRRRVRGGRRDKRTDLAIDAHAAAVILEEWLRAHEAPSLSAAIPRENEA